MWSFSGYFQRFETWLSRYGSNFWHLIIPTGSSWRNACLIKDMKDSFVGHFDEEIRFALDFDFHKIIRKKKARKMCISCQRSKDFLILWNEVAYNLLIYRTVCMFSRVIGRAWSTGKPSAGMAGKLTWEWDVVCFCWRGPRKRQLPAGDVTALVLLIYLFIYFLPTTFTPRHLHIYSAATHSLRKISL